MTATGKGKIAFKVLVAIHNLTNVPQEMTTQPADTTFLVALRLVTHSRGSVAVLDVASTTAQDVAQPFYAKDVVDRNGLFTVAFTKAVRDWHVVVPAENSAGKIDILLDVAERRGGKDGVRRSLSQQRHSINLADVLERKIITHIVGTPCGQLGISFTVSPTDKQGYRDRLKAFVERHNPDNAGHIEDVVEKAPEIASFTRVFKKYRVVDYRARVQDFFQMYGPEYLSHIDETLEQWKDREEEFIRSLVLDNGPEPRDIPVRQRLEAHANVLGGARPCPGH
jgi:hypothetical protein